MEHITLYLVTGNRNKYLEALDALKGTRIDLRMLEMEKTEIQADRVEDIALYAAQSAYQRTSLPVVVDDTGLYIDALNGFPGPYASYVYKTIGLEGVLRLLNGTDDRRACFKTAVAAVIGNKSIIATGETCGWIAQEPRGGYGFGYDPIFIPEGSSKTYAEMTLEEKNRYSHRSKAFKKLAVLLGGL
ncbi:MAG: XTP/dITP diphosphatase [Desulfurococcales archaeon]|nr:XTP/dITP diphosphatase [Desulfurococcales archaeon]